MSKKLYFDNCVHMLCSFLLYYYSAHLEELLNINELAICYMKCSFFFLLPDCPFSSTVCGLTLDWPCNSIPSSSVLVQPDFSHLEIVPSEEAEGHLPVFSCVCLLLKQMSDLLTGGASLYRTLHKVDSQWFLLVIIIVAALCDNKPPPPCIITVFLLNLSLVSSCFWTSAQSNFTNQHKTDEEKEFSCTWDEDVSRSR